VSDVVAVAQYRRIARLRRPQDRLEQRVPTQGLWAQTSAGLSRMRRSTVPRRRLRWVVSP
jgi:hypothetical protein